MGNRQEDLTQRSMCSTRAMSSLRSQKHGGIVRVVESGYRLFGKDRLGWQGEEIVFI